MKPDLTHIQKVLIVTLSNLGDVVLTLPVFQSLARAFPKAEFHAIVGAGGAAVFAEDLRLKKVMVYDKKMSWARKWKFLRAVRTERYDLIVDLRRSAIGLLGGARFHNTYFTAFSRRGHRALRHLEALKGIAPVHSEESFLRITAAAEENLKRLMAQEAPTTSGEASRLVVCAVGSKSDIKKWPAENYAELLDRLAVNQKARIVLIGDQNDAADAAKVKSLMSMPAMNLAGRTNFQELCAALKTADLLITNDSAPLHVADALGVPILAIFGPTDSKKYGPRSFGSQAVHRTLFCSPCEKAQCRFRHECMKELGVSEVYRRAAQILYDEMTPRAPRILAIRLDRIGDLVLSFPALSAIKERFPESTLSVMTRASTQSIAENHPAVDEVIPYFYEKGGRHRFIKGNIRFIHEIIRRRFDIVFILNPSVRSYLVPFVARIPYRVGFQVPVPFLLTHSVPDHRHQGKKHESEYTLDAVRAFGIKPSGSPYPVWPVSLYDLLKIAARLKNISCLPDALPRGGVSGCAEELLTPPRGTASIDPIIAIHAGSSCPSKRWPKEKFAELGTRMIQEGYRVAVIGGSNERTLGEYLKRAIGENVLDLTGELELPELAAFLKRCTALVSNDSGPVHIAAAVGTPVLSIFGRTQSGLSPVRWRPLGRETAVIQKNVGCVVCLAHRCTIEFECLKALAVEEVSRALQMILKKYQNEIQRS